MLKRVSLVTCVIALLFAGTATALRIQAGDMIMNINGGFSPTSLPAHRDAPITLQGSMNVKMDDEGELPPVLQRMHLEFDRHGHVQTRGLNVCRRRDIEDSTSKDARRRCRGSIIGTGWGKVVVKFPDQAPIPASTPITLFNGPRIGNTPTVWGHGFLTVPAPTAYVVPIRIERINKGRYGYKTDVRFPPIAGGHGIPLAGAIKIGKTWRFRGRTLSYVNARCVGRRLQARGIFFYRDGTQMDGSLMRPCSVRRR